jgi:hypothetical protein
MKPKYEDEPYMVAGNNWQYIGVPLTEPLEEITIQVTPEQKKQIEEILKDENNCND